MSDTARAPLEATPLLSAVLVSGAAGLSWEVLYQHHAALALGVSAYGTAVTLAAMMAGMSLGGWLAARLARAGALSRPLRAYGVAEIVIGLASLAVPPLLDLLASLDVFVWRSAQGLAPVVRLLGTFLILIVPATAMGATIPIIAPAARRAGTNVSAAYALNTAGAVLGILAVTFVILPEVGVMRTAWIAAALNLAVGVYGIAVGGRGGEHEAESDGSWPPPRALALAFLSGAAIFALEVSWFRSIRAALQSTTEAFAITIAAFLTALSIGAALASLARRRGLDLIGLVLPLAGGAILIATPMIDALDRFTTPTLEASVAPTLFSAGLGIKRFAWVMGLCGLPAALLGTIFPSLLARHDSTGGSGRLYVVNSAGAVLGSLTAGFLLLPTIGATRTSWGVGLAICAATLLVPSVPRRALAGALVAAVLGLGVATTMEGSSGRNRVQGHGWPEDGEVDFVREGADATTWVVDVDGTHLLVIDGFIASLEHTTSNYMPWMGHLPALAARELDRTLVICMGTGQTADAVRDHGPGHLEVVDLNRAVFDAAPLFETNEGVLEDPRVDTSVMDGRAFLRRTEERFDLITLEPMPPNFAGSNHLYSTEFYELARDRLAPGGTAAQWLPIHLTGETDTRAIIGSFAEVFPYTRLWQDPVTKTGVLVGGLEPWTFSEPAIPLDYSLEQIERQVLLDFDEIRFLVAGGPRVTDDNQRLSYGRDRFERGAASGTAWATALSARNTRMLFQSRLHPR